MAATARSGGGRRRAPSAGARPAPKPSPEVKKATRPRRTPARAPAPAAEVPASPETSVLVLTSPEPGFVARVPPPVAERPRPTTRRAIFLDVENTSRAQHLAHVVDHLAVNHPDCQTDLVAVANWKVVSHDSARLLAKMGAHLVHSAPSTGVRDWSDLRIAVAAGIWLAAARPGDAIEIVSDDRAFDAVGDVAASLGIGFRRLSYRQLIKEDVTETPAPAPPRAPESASRRRRRRGGRGRSGPPGPPRAEARPREPGALRGTPRPARPPAAEPVADRPRAPAAHGAGPAEPHTAPHDAIVSVVRDLVDASPGRRISIDALANALKSRGFRRPPGSPRLMTRLRRIREIVVSPSGTVTLAAEASGVSNGGGDVAEDRWPPPEEATGGDSLEPGDESEPEAAAAAAGAASLPEAGRGRRRRRRRRWSGPRRPAPSAPPA